MHRCFLLLTLLLTSALSASAVAPVHKRVLPNGLTVLVREDRSAPVVSAQAWVRAGSVTEAEWMGAGLSHVLEHMLFKGTTKRGVAQIAQEVEAHGGYINAYTSFEQTVYYIDLPAANWRVAVDILADCMMNATIPAEELEKEKQVIHREMAMNQDNPDRRASLLLFNAAYTTLPASGHRLSRHLRSHHARRRGGVLPATLCPQQPDVCHRRRCERGGSVP